MSRSAIPFNLRPHLTEIADRLSSGNAAVMVGAGLSRNASPAFPDWSELGDRFHKKLHDSKPAGGDSYLSVPELAHEVEAALGRPALDQMLRDAIPDQKYEPSELHIKLLELSWSDVFTTNYDTLLERTRGKINSRRYDIVVCQDDLIYSEKPRIVKLHGTLPSVRPFIVTDEDYRCYPDVFAPFVNTVRQALLENTLCLVGFSGNDPNFKQWVGWIHDNLGRQNSPKMYLVGNLRLSDTQSKLLEQRNIVPVDMSEYADIEAHDHGKALQRFIAHLNDRMERSTPLDWPRNPKFEGLDPKKDQAVQLREILSNWKEARRSYPGWVIVPERRRRLLWDATMKWIAIPPRRESLPDFLDLEFAFELIWRMERCLSPIFDDQIAFLEATIDRYLSADPDAWSESRSRRCHHLLLALLRFYREEGRIEQWNSTREKINDCVTTMSPEHKACFYYERALAALFELNPRRLKERIEKWPADDSLPFWEAKRAGLLAEAGQLRDAERVLTNSLETIRTRSNLKPVTTDFSLVSQESFVMLLLKSVRMARHFGTDEPITKEEHNTFKNRWHALRQHDCDPWHELEAFERALGRPPVNTPTKNPTFDIGVVRHKHHFGEINPEELTAYGFLRFCEDAGIPFRMPGCTIAVKSAEGTLARIAPHSSYWAMATLVRTGNNRVVGSIFDRASLAGMETAAVDSLIDRYLKSLDLGSVDIGARTHHIHWGGNFGILLAKVIPEILSRLCCRCSPDAKERLLDFLVGIYRSDDRSAYEGIKNLTPRLLEAFSVEQRIKAIPKLLEIPIVFEREYANPFEYLRIKMDALSGTPAIANEDLGVFVEGASSDDERTRRWATLTLGRLHEWGLLSVHSSERFADALWGRLDDNGLPSDTDYLPHAFLTLPHPANVNPTEVFKKWVRDQKSPVQVDGVTLEWSDDEARSIVHRLVAWWDANKEQQTRRLRSKTDELSREGIKTTLSRFTSTMAAVIKPHFNPTSGSGTRNELKHIVREWSEHGLPTLRLEAACLRLFPDRRDGVFRRIEEGIASSAKETVIDALEAVAVVSDRVGADGPKREREDLVRILSTAGQALRWRRESGLTTTINLIAHVTRRHPWSFTRNIEKPVLDGLQHLIGDTAIRPPEDPILGVNKDDRDVATKLIVRRAAAGLAYVLAKHYEKRGESAPGTIREWESICRSDDEFAEVRNQWA